MYSRSLFVVLSISVFLISQHTIISAPKGSKILKREAKTVSDKKVLEIEAIIVEYNKSKDINLSKQMIEKNVLEKVDNLFKVNTAYKLEKINYSKIKKDVDKQTVLKFPLTEKELKVKFRNEAEEIYKFAEKQTKVIVKYKKGRYFHTLSGVYYGLTPRRNGIRVGKQTIPLFDLTPEDKLRFVKEIRDLKVKKYIRQKLREHKELKELFESQQITKEMNIIIRKNESEGYIMVWRKWRTPQEVAKLILDYYSS